ncbi:Penicillin-binding protein 2 (fragment) [Candidatus Desulfosporosinus infrequens]|uniref:Penicillin-binding protein 2 n=1 Tax=Candidatus Desulfosporosinus infrequens TaxID=2043169 RepID=A0A2U3L884_9FIRM
MWITEKSRRMHIMLVVIAGITIGLIFRLGWMQIIKGPQYKKIAEDNRIRQITAEAPRGNMYDRNGALLVTNRPSFAISIIPSEYTNGVNATPILGDILGIKPEEIEKMLKEGEEFLYTPIRVKRDVDEVAIAKIQERQYYLPGVIVEAVPVRHYIYKEVAAQVLGFIGNINEDEYESRKPQGYSPNDFIGKDGLEREWENLLRGIDGGLQVEINALGEEVH